MNIQSNVSLRRSDLPATFESLNDDTLTTTLQFVGDKSYRSFGGINKRCKEIYLSSGMTKKTFLFGYAPLSVIQDRIERAGYDWEFHQRVGKGVVLYNRRDVFEWALQKRKRDVSKGICNVAAEEGSIDILEEMWNKVTGDRKRYIFDYVDVYAAGGGKLNVIKWLETKGFDGNKILCSFAAASGGQLHILEWLREEHGLELNGKLYNSAIQGGHLHVMKWLREKKVPWDDDIFMRAACEGNLDILQWLHDEGCPWGHDDYLCVYEDRVKPEVIDWLRVNGYGDRIDSDSDEDY